MSTQLSDLNFQSDYFKTKVSATFHKKLALLTSGVFVKAPAGFFNYVGKTGTAPHWDQATGTPNRIINGLTTTFNEGSDWVEKYIWSEEEIAWDADQIIKTTAGDDNDYIAEVAAQVGNYLAEYLHARGINHFKGAFATALSSSHSYTDEGNTINIKGLNAAKLKLTDNKAVFKSIIMAPKVENDALNEQILTYNQAVNADSAYVNGVTGNILGMVPSITSDIAPVGGYYSSFMSAPGTLLYDFRPRKRASISNANVVNILDNVEMEIYRNSITSGGVDGLIFRWSVATHMPGVSWGGSVAEGGPIHSELATGSNWTSVAEDARYIKVVEYKSN